MTDVLVKVKPVKPDEVTAVTKPDAVVPYDPLITLKKALSTAALSGLAFALTGLGEWALQDGNTSLLLSIVKVDGPARILATPILHGLIKAGINFTKTRFGIQFEKVGRV